MPRTNPLHHSETSAATLNEMIGGFRGTQLVYVTAKLGLADLLKDGPRRSDDLASVLGVHPQALTRLLRALATLGIVDCVPPESFALTSLSTLLQTDAPNSLRNHALLAGELNYRTWGDLHYSIATGMPGFDHIHDTDFFAHLTRNPRLAALFDAGMTEGNARRNAAIVASYDFSACRMIVDVGGGQGALLAAILNASPTTHGILFDLPHVLEGVTWRQERQEVIDRCRIISGNMFVSVPTGGDLYLLAGVLHDWADDAARMILANCRRAMDTGATLLVAEHVVPTDNAPFPAALVDIAMLVNTGGKERALTEFRTLFADTDFTLADSRRTGWGRIIVGKARDK